MSKQLESIFKITAITCAGSVFFYNGELLKYISFFLCITIVAVKALLLGCHYMVNIQMEFRNEWANINDELEKSNRKIKGMKLLANITIYLYLILMFMMFAFDAELGNGVVIPMVIFTYLVVKEMGKEYNLYYEEQIKIIKQYTIKKQKEQEIEAKVKEVISNMVKEESPYKKIQLIGE